MDRVAVVTGASRGIGAGMARAFVGRGLRVGGCARSLPEGFPEVEGRTLYAQVDVRDVTALSAFADEAERELGPIDLWVNNAGLLDPIGATAGVDPEAFRRQVDVNLLGVYHGCRVFLERLHAAGREGTVVNMGSGASTSPYRGWGAYCATKAAVDQLTRVLALEEAPHGIRVHCLAPGIVETGMQELIRAQDAEDFPDVELFRQLHRDGALLDPEAPAEAVLRLAFGPRITEPVVDARDTPELQAPSD